MVADAFNHGLGSTVADTESLGRTTAEERLACCGAIQEDVAHQHTACGIKRALLGRVNDDPPARESLADVVVGISFQIQRNSLCQESAKTLAG